MDRAEADHAKTVTVLLAIAALVAGPVLYAAGNGRLADIAWFAGTVPSLATLVVELLLSIGRGEVGLDIVAALSMTAALAFGATPAAAVMYLGGTFLASVAEGHARSEMHDSQVRVPRSATRHRNGGLKEVLSFFPDRRRSEVRSAPGAHLAASTWNGAAQVSGWACVRRMSRISQRP